MTDHERLESLLSSAFPPATVSEPSRDLWPSILEPHWAPQRIPWVDISLGVVVGIGLLLAPDWLWLLALHL